MRSSAGNAHDLLWQMGRSDTLVWVHVDENAKGSQVDLANPPRDPDFIATRDARNGAKMAPNVYEPF